MMVRSDVAGSVAPLWFFARRGRTHAKHCAAMLAGLLLICNGAGAQTRDAQHRGLSVMPDALIGVWHRNDHDGRSDCEAFRKIESADDITEETDGLIGSLIINSHLVHAYSDYGEGNFYLVNRVVGLGSQQWQVDALVGIDSMPSDGEGDYEETFRFVFASGLLSMNETGVTSRIAQTTEYFRCGKVLDGMYLESGEDG